MRVALLFLLAICATSGVLGGLLDHSVVDLAWGNLGVGRVDLPATTIGQSGKFSTEFQIVRHGSPSTSTILYLGDQNRLFGNDVEVTLNRNNQIGVRVGAVTRTTGFSIPSTINNNGQWHYVAIVIENTGTSGAKLSVWVDGVDQSGTLDSRTFPVGIPSAQRNRNFIGYTPTDITYGNKVAGVSGSFDGMIDALALWDLALTSTVIQNHAALSGGSWAVDTEGLIVQYDFDEGGGSEAFGLPGTSASESYTAVLLSPFSSFSSRVFVGWSSCQGTGDPHWVDLYGAAFDTPHVEGYFTDLTCLADNGQSQFSIQSYHITGCCWGYHTVIRAINVRLGTSIFQYAAPQVAGTVVAGPLVYKELAPGQSAGSVPWTAMSRTRTVLNSGLTITFPDSATILIYGAPFGYLTYTEAGNYGNLYIKVSASCNRGQSRDVCTGKANTQVDNWTFQNPPIAPVAFVETPVYVPPTPTDPCASVTPAYKTKVETYCKRSFPDWASAQAAGYASCMFDGCLTIIPEDPVCTDGVCCKPTGQYNDVTRTCDCDAGYTGPDCGSKSTIAVYSLTTASTKYDNLDYVIVGHDLGSSVPAGVDNSLAANPGALAAANKWSVKNSILVYVATVDRIDATTFQPFTDTHVYFVDDASSSSSTQTHTATFTYDGPSTTNVVPIGAVTTSTVQAPSSVTFRPAPNVVSGLVFPFMPATWCIHVTTDYSGQVLVGSGNENGKLDVIRVVPAPGATSNVFSVCGKPEANPCANILSCPECSANPSCGWCRTTQSCRLGRPSGPIDGTTCVAWAFTFDATTSRRITQKYGYPVNPVDTTVILQQGSVDLPIELTVDMGYRFGAVWDLALLWPTGQSSGGLLTALKTNIAGLAARLGADYPSIGLALSTYSGASYTPVFSLVGPGPNAATINGLTSSLSINTAAASADFNAAILRMGATQHPGWRNGFRHLLLVVVDEAIAQAPSPDVYSNLLAQGVFPIFAATSATAKVSCVTYVESLKFGLVIDATTISSSILAVVERALTDAAGAIGVALPQGKEGRVDTAQLFNGHNGQTLTVSGMMDGMRSRVVLPLSAGSGTSATTTVVAPGFGTATIEQIASDAPYTNALARNLVVDQKLTPFSNTINGAILYFTGKPADVLNSDASVAADVISYDSTKGSLFQFDATKLATEGLTEVSVATGFVLIPSTGGKVNDVQGRAIYVTPDNAWSTADNYKWDTIMYTVTDQCSTSPAGPLPIFLYYANNEPPTAPMVAQKTSENKAVLITLAGVDTRQHDLKATITSIATSSAANKAIAGTLYQYSSACWTAVQADFLLGVASCTPITVGFVTGTDRRIIYVPYQYANSEGLPMVYQTLPSVSYKIVQVPNALDACTKKATCVPLESGISTFTITVSAVNQKPSVSDVPLNGETWLSFPNAHPAPVGCSSQQPCNYNQNLGVPYPNLPTAVPLYIAGTDVEGGALTVKLVSVVCGARAVLNESSTLLPASTGSSLSNLPSNNGYYPLLSFLPTADGFATPYCVVTYKVNDGEFDSEDQATITINIAEVPLPPRSNPVTVYAPRRAPTPYEFSAWGVGQGVKIAKAIVTGCPSPSSGSVLVIEGVTIDCSSAQEIPVPEQVQLASGSYQATFKGSWTPGDDTADESNQLIITIEFLDTHSTPLTSVPVNHVFLYRRINFAPELTFLPAQKPVATSGPAFYTVNFQASSSIITEPINFNASDVDSGAARVSAVVSIEGPEACIAFPSAFLNILSPNGGCHKRFTINGAVTTVSNVLQLMKFQAPKKEANYTVSVVVSDEAASGACSYDNPLPCAKFAVATVYIYVVPATNFQAAIIAGAAGGAVAAAAAAAAIAWKKINKPPTDNYNPWEMDDTAEGTVMNPLFEDAGRSGNNPMFEAGAN